MLTVATARVSIRISLLLAGCLLAGCGGDVTATDANGPGPDAPLQADGAPAADLAPDLPGPDGADAPDVLAPDGSPPASGLFSPAVTEVVIEVDYQAGAEPYTGAMLSGDTWDLFDTNARALFEGAPRSFSIPARLEQMERLDDISGEDFDSAQILAIAAAHRQQVDTASRRTFYLVFLDGFYNDDQGRNEAVLGVSLGTSGVMAVFKPVVEGSGTGLGTGVEPLVEQTTLVHEFGHAVGLVDNGVVLTSDHHDTAHPAHCTNQDCVMYWQNEGVGDLVDYVAGHIGSSDTLVFGQECLADTRAAAAGATP